MARFTRRGALGLAAAALPAARPGAQGLWNPTRPITLVVGFPTGGQTDFAARVIQSGLQKALGVSVTIDNRAGAGGNLGTEAVMAARPDGYTLLAGNISPMVINPHTMDGMMIDPREMTPIGLILRSSLILCTHPSLQVRNLAELRAWIAAQPRGSIQYGSTSTGSLTHIAMELFRERLGKPEMTQLPYRGSGPAMVDFVAGRFSLMFDGASVVAPLVQSGQLRCVLATGRTRSPAFPDLPTAEQQGLSDFAFYSWTGLFAPRGTAPEIVTRLNAALNAALAEPPIRSRITERGTEPGGGSAEEMARIMAEDYARWGEVVRANQIRVES
ncbi:tripartite tricarboxylate transporter substrate binding protein [Roseococcus sp. SDR]|uniref:Bug family tripartite tricarboxylate transporter substrate binding protein n=1 Tax=Roseococcus sp. SDR TaxID=2835532 RepID=UPI0020BE653F|nr:tripartite tricarboxylate transporter substrate binding protein [Roseococcus sp. SDR]